MHIIHTTGTIGEWAGGPSRTVTRLCSSIARPGCSVDLVTGHDPERDQELILPDSRLVNLHFVRAKRMIGINTYPGFTDTVESLVVKYRRNKAPVLIHDHGIWTLTNIAAARAAHRAEIPYVLHPRGMLEPWAFNYKGRKKKLAWFLYQKRIVENAAAIVATSIQERDSIKNIFPRIPVAVIPNGVPFPTTLPHRTQRIDPRFYYVLFMSRIHPVKNITGLVRAWCQVCSDSTRSNWILQIAGPDQQGHTGEVKALVNSLGLASRVEFLGAISEGDKHKLYEAADVFVLPSFSENFGVVVAEALAHGLPVVATLGTPWSELVNRGCGWWVDPSPDNLAQAIAEAIDLSQSDRSAMGIRGRDFAHAVFSWDGIGTSTVQLYEWVLGLSSSRPSFVHV